LEQELLVQAVEELGLLVQPFPSQPSNASLPCLQLSLLEFVPWRRSRLAFLSVSLRLL
jgi:hypothetical protein